MKRALLPALILLSSVPSPAGDLLRPDEIIPSLEKATRKAPIPLGNKAETLLAQLEDFTATASSLTPKEAAEGWLALFRSWRELTNQDRGVIRSPRNLGFEALVKALPPPAAWDALRAKIAPGLEKDAMVDGLLALFTATLTEDPDGQMKAFAALWELTNGNINGSPHLKLVKRTDGKRAEEDVSSMIFDLAGPLAKLSDDPSQVRHLLEMQLGALVDLNKGYRASINLPGVVALGDEEKARELIRKILNAGILLSSNDRQLRALARRMILEDSALLKAPQWSLVDGISMDDVQLYQMLEQDWASNDETLSARDRATEYYLLALIVNGKPDEAVACLAALKDRSETRLPYAPLKMALAQHKDGLVLAFLFESLAKDPSLPFWSDLIDLAARRGRSGEALELARKSIQVKTLSPAGKNSLLSTLVAAALAHGNVDEAAGYMRQKITDLETQGDSKRREALLCAERMARLGQLLDLPKLRDEGIRHALAIAATPSERVNPSPEFLALLAECGRAADAQAQMVGRLRFLLSGERSTSSQYLPENLVNLAGLYDQTRQPDAVIALLAEAPWWNARDLVEIVGKKDFRKVTMGEISARAFLANGDKARAVEALKESLRAASSNDRAYRMLIDIEGQKARAFLDKLYARNQFEERPLIWKAILQLQAGETEDAERTIRRAIAIDPSDGEMGPDDRLRAYAVLAEILEKTGRQNDAKVFRGAVEAVRLAERADTYLSAGLYAQAITMYKEALTYFADAYCIQSRLAVQLANQGDIQQAEEHYRRAYELMPESFGRMESHCFGCERAFDGEMAESLAERTFRKMLEENPAKPQLYYLMGYLRATQGKPEEALTNYRKAVELDPDYVNAWKKILALEDSIVLPNSIRSEAALAMARLQPNGSTSQVREVTDLKQLWALAERLSREYPEEKPRGIFRLEAAAAFLEGERKTGTNFYVQTVQPKRLTDPGAAVANQAVIEQISRTFDKISRYRR